MEQSVLIIDDSYDMHQLLKVRLRTEVQRFHHALSAEAGLRLAVERQPDLILLDVDLPGMNGFDVCRELKIDPRTVMIPIIFLTGESDIEAKIKGFEMGAVDYVTKPFEPAELRARVRAALRTKRFQDLLAARAQVDGLTGLLNRGCFNQRLSEEVANVLRYGRTLALLMIDIDHFKQLNDRYGHPFGDQVLQQLAEVLVGSIREGDSAYRYGGEEFAVLLTEPKEGGGEEVARRIHERLAGLILCHPSGTVNVTASVGVASSSIFPAGGLTAQTLVAAADAALYQAKHEGRNRTCTAMSGQAAIPRRETGPDR